MAFGIRPMTWPGATCLKSVIWCSSICHVSSKCLITFLCSSPHKTDCCFSDATSGTTQDWGKGGAEIKYSHTFELRGGSFAPPPSAIPPSREEIWNGLVAFAADSVANPWLPWRCQQSNAEPLFQINNAQTAITVSLSPDLKTVNFGTLHIYHI